MPLVHVDFTNDDGLCMPDEHAMLLAALGYGIGVVVVALGCAYKVWRFLRA